MGSTNLFLNKSMIEPFREKRLHPVLWNHAIFAASAIPISLDNKTCIHYDNFPKDRIIY
jgi:hypothetical protein